MVSKTYCTNTITNDFPESICCWCTFYTHKFLSFHCEHNFYLCSFFITIISKQNTLHLLSQVCTSFWIRRYIYQLEYYLYKSRRISQNVLKKLNFSKSLNPTFMETKTWIISICVGLEHSVPWTNKKSMFEFFCSFSTTCSNSKLSKNSKGS